MQPSPASVTSITEQHNCAQTNFGDCGACNFSIGEPGWMEDEAVEANFDRLVI